MLVTLRGYRAKVICMPLRSVMLTGSILSSIKSWKQTLCASSGWGGWIQNGQLKISRKKALVDIRLKPEQLWLGKVFDKTLPH